MLENKSYIYIKISQCKKLFIASVTSDFGR